MQKVNSLSINDPYVGTLLNNRLFIEYLISCKLSSIMVIRALFQSFIDLVVWRTQVSYTEFSILDSNSGNILQFHLNPLLISLLWELSYILNRTYVI